MGKENDAAAVCSGCVILFPHWSPTRCSGVIFGTFVRRKGPGFMSVGCINLKFLFNFGAQSKRYCPKKTAEYDFASTKLLNFRTFGAQKARVYRINVHAVFCKNRIYNFHVILEHKNTWSGFLSVRIQAFPMLSVHRAGDVIAGGLISWVR